MPTIEESGLDRPVTVLKGTMEQELAWTPRDLFPEACGLAAAVFLDQASQYIYDCLVLQEHRGEHGVGVVSVNEGQLHSYRRTGLVRHKLASVDLNRELPGQVAIGHNRYATQGRHDVISNVQPLIFHTTRFGPFAIAHNGTLIDNDGLRNRMIEEGIAFQSTTDTEIFGHLIAHSKEPDLERAVVDAANKIEAAYSFLILSPDRLIALRDRFGVRPLSVGKIGDGYIYCSENYALDQFPDIHDVEDIKPGEISVIDLAEPGSERRYSYIEGESHFCVFEGIYFSDPRSRYNGWWHEDFRVRLGSMVARENRDLAGDCVVPVLDSGKHSAMGLANALNIPYEELFKRLHNPPRAGGRSFTAATTEERTRAAWQKLHLRQERVRDRRIIVVDDSVVRSTTIRIINNRLRQAGAREIINVITAPPISNICPYGMDYQTREELIAYKKSIEEIRDSVQADQLIYLTLEGLHECVLETFKTGVCSGCFGGRYPIEPQVPVLAH